MVEEGHKISVAQMRGLNFIAADFFSEFEIPLLKKMTASRILDVLIL